MLNSQIKAAQKNDRIQWTTFSRSITETVMREISPFKFLPNHMLILVIVYKSRTNKKKLSFTAILFTDSTRTNCTQTQHLLKMAEKIQIKTLWVGG